MKHKLSNTVKLLITVTMSFLVIAAIFFAGVFSGINNTHEYRVQKDTLTEYKVVFKDTTITLNHFIIEIDTVVKRDTVYIHEITQR